MFFNRKQTVATVLDLTPADPPAGTRVEKSDFGGVELKEYSAVAGKIGLANGALLAAQLKDFFAEEGIRLYDYAKVSSFLAEKVKKEGKDTNGNQRLWCWKPFRTVDDGKLISSTIRWNENGHIAKGQYYGAVPYPVLLTVEKIAQRFGDQVHFYVSDYTSVNPDPFLAVAGAGVDMLVVERWDEPNFRG